MKRIAQFAAVLAIALLVAQPALAASICVFGQSEPCVTACPMAMDNMGPDCPMASGMVASGCSMDCCSHSVVQAVEPLAAPSKVRIMAQPIIFSEPLPISVASPHAAAREIIEIRSVSPPRYILIQVFRI